MDDERGVGYTVVVDVPAGPSNEYAVGHEARFMLSAVNPNVASRLYEIGYFRFDLDQDVTAPVIVPMRIPTFQGCQVSARPIAMVLTPDGAVAAWVAVPQADEALAQANELDQLPEPFRAVVRAALGDAAIAGQAETLAALGVVRETALRRQAATRERPAIAAWKTGSISSARLRPGAEGPYTKAEHAVPLLPLRFQKYISRELLADERILTFIQRPAFTPGGTRRSLRRRHVSEGILVLTDRQLLFMADALDPDATLVHWGYIAQVSAAERIECASVHRERDSVLLKVVLRGQSGSQHLSFLFPNEALSAIKDSLSLFNGFAVKSGSRQIRRIYQVEPSSQTAPPARPGTDPAPLSWAQTRAGTRVSVTNAVVSLHAPGGKPSRVEKIADVTSLELTLALMGCRLRWWTAKGNQVSSDGFDFDYPQASEFLSVFTTLRQLLGQASPGSSDGESR